LNRYQEIARLKEEKRQLQQNLDGIKQFAQSVDEILQENNQ